MHTTRRIIPAVATLALAACGSAAAPPAPTDSAPDADQSPTESQPVSPEAAEPESAAEDGAPETAALSVSGEDVNITSGGQDYPSYASGPAEGGPYPGIVLVHSINGMEEGYRTLSDRLAAQGFVVLALGWQTFERTPPDATVQGLVTEGIAYLLARPDVDSERLGLTGFCIGGYYTMLFLPQFADFKAGVAWYGFPYRGDPQPADLIDDLDAPMLVIHGTEDNPSPIEDIYRYTDALTDAGKTFELEVYEGEPHGFMLSDGQLREDEIALDAFTKMVVFFRRYLG